MLVFRLLRDGLYLAEGDISDPSKARVAFLFQDAGRTDPSFTLSQATWLDPNSQGYFAFFVPKANRDWKAFAVAVRNAFTGTQDAQLGWFAESGASVSAVTLISVTRSDPQNPVVSQGFSLTFNNVALQVSNPFSPSPIAYDDPSNSFRIENPSQQNIQLTAQPPGQPTQSYQSPSDNLVLPMDDTQNVHAASVSADFPFSVIDLAAGFEAGFMYFGPGENQLLTALSYPFLRAPGGAAAPLNFTAWLDVLQPLVDTRTYFAATDAVVGSYFTAANGKIFALTTTNGSDPRLTSRYAFANRPLNNPTDTGNYYLTPAGSFGLSLDGSPAPDDPVDLLCGVTGTEFLNLAVGEASLLLQTGQPAFQKTTASSTAAPPILLDSIDGNVTTSWISLVSTDGSYISQPQDAPLFNQNSGAAQAESLNVFVLDFLPLPAWTASSGAAALGAQVASPLVPMVPYSGLVFTTPDLAAPYLAMESVAINPTRKNAFTEAQSAITRALRAAKPFVAAPADALTNAMTPQGLLAGLAGTAPNLEWQATRIALSPDTGEILQFTSMGDEIRAALQQNQIFLVVSTLTFDGRPLFGFAGPDQTINLSGWPFSLSPAGTTSSDDTPPIVILKFYPGQSIQDLVADISLWSQPNVFNTTFTAAQAKAFITEQIEFACEQVYGAGNCPPKPGAQPDTSSLYYNFYRVVTDPQFAGLLALNCNMQLNNLPTAIRAVTGGMNYRDKDGNVVSNIDAFRVHHVGVSINDTDPNSSTPSLAQSSLFALVDYEKPESSGSGSNGGLAVDYGFEVQFLRALFTNSALTSFSCRINLTINNLFGTKVDLEQDSVSDSGGDKNVIVITGSYQAHSTTGDDATSGEGLYSFIAEGNFVFKFGTNPYLDNITLTKLQFSFLQETAQSGPTSTIQASFTISGNLAFKEFNVLDIFSFEKLVFNDLGIAVTFDLTVPPPPASPTTSKLQLSFSPGNLRLDLANSTPKEGSNSLLSLLPFKLTSFLYNQFPDNQTVEDTGYYSITSLPLDPGFSLVDKFSYALLFDLDLGTLGALVGSLQAFKFSFLIGWLADQETAAGGIAFGVQLPQADGKLEIKIQGVLTLLIEEFILRYQTPADGGQAMLVLALHNSSIEILGQRLPPGSANFDFALFAPISDSSRIGWITAVNNEGAGGDAGNGGGGSFQLKYLGLGQRVGPDPNDPPTNFKDFLAFMTGDFFKAISDQEYDKVYHPDSQWLALTDLRLLDKIQVGFIFYDSTPFYSLTLNVDKLFNFEITYTKVSDSIGLFYANFSLPDNLRTFQVGAASLTLPSIGVSVYTNGDFKIDLGFPNNDDWSRSFRVQAQAGPIPITGSGGFYIASLSSATSSVFKGTYDSILAFGFAARLGVGKDFTAGPLKAGVSVTFFGIIQGAAGYRNSLSNDIFRKPDALQLQGQFGVIGELYGSLDFVIIKASVNVRLQASIGIILSMEKGVPGADGSILLYIEASVRVSVSVEIDLFLFSITISFSFQASFRFQWQLLGEGSTNEVLEAKQFLLERRAATAALAAIATLPLIPGFTTDLVIWYLPEGTVIFPATTGIGTPWIVSSLGIQYDNKPSGTPEYASFKQFEQVTTQLVTWAVGAALGLPGFQYTVTQAQIDALDQTPELLVGSIDYEALLSELAVFAKTTVIVPSADAGATLYAATFPMPPFFRLQTTGRMKGTAPDDLNYVFSEKSNVPPSYVALVDAYFNQLFVNQTSGGSSALTEAADDDPVPLIRVIFLNYFTGLIRGAVHQLLETMQNGDIPSAPIDQVIRAAVGSGQFATLSGQMSSSFRGGTRLPYVDGLTVPDGNALKTTNAQYALLWQEFPAGTPGGSGEYSIQLTNADPSQPDQKWITSPAAFKVTSAFLQPFQNAQATDITPPTAPVQLPFTSIGPQAFAFENSVVWTKPDTTQVSLRPFISALQNLQSSQGAAISALVESRETGAPYLPGGTPLPPNAFAWATQVPLTVTQVPDNKGKPLPDVFALTGASQSAQLLLEQIIDAQRSAGIIASVQLLYQTASGSTGLTSKRVTPANVFVLRTNTTTTSTPPSASFVASFTFEGEPPPVPVGAQIDDFANFLQIVQQAAVTNATGYYLRYLDDDGKSLPPDLFGGAPAPLTVLITYLADNSQNTPASPAKIQPYYNSIVLNAAQPALTYYAETTDPKLAIQYGTVAAGSIGALLTRDDSASLVSVNATLAATASVEPSRNYLRSELRRLILDAGVCEEATVNQLLAESGGNASQLNALYSLITYQVQATSGFVESNLSAPIQPQQPTADSSAADGLAEATEATRSYRVYAPLYNVATANQPLTPDKIPNRYASIGSPVSINFFQNDAFGNQTAAPLGFASTNFYFDPIVPVDQWQGVVTAYDFSNNSSAQPNTFTVYLNPSAVAFTSLTVDQAASALQAYTTILDQITGPGVTFAIETNLALQSDGSMAEVALTPEQTKAIVAMVGGIVTYLENFTIPAPPFNVAAVPLTVAATGPGAIPPAFEIAVLLDVRRDPNLISPTLKDQFGNVTFPSAQQVSTTVVSTVGASLPNGAGSVDITTFAKFFVQAFPRLALSVGLNGAQSTSSATATSFAVRRSNLLRLTGVATDGSAPSQASPQSLWAVQQSLLDITIGTGSGAGPFYLSPEPLDNTLNSATVPLPPLPDGLRPADWPATQLFTDVDLDQINSVFFSAVDQFLAPESAAHTFEVARPAYDTSAQGRGSIAALYSLREIDWLFGPDAPFTGTMDQLTAAQAAFEQQMRAALATAYTTDTIVQYGVSFKTPPPAGVDNFFELFGSIQPTGGAKLPQGFTLSSPHVPITSSGSSFLTFLFGAADVRDAANIELDLEFNVTHIQRFLESVPPDPGEARASIWLQLVNPYPNGLPHLGSGTTDIPLVLREYPAPPTVINQQGPQGSGSQQAASDNPLVAAAAWHFIYTYQAQITAHDLIGTAVTYNTDLRASQGNGSGLNANALAGAEVFTLFQALARFSATYPVILPSLSAPPDPNSAAAAQVFASLVTDVVTNTTWTPPPAFALAQPQPNITDDYTVTDVAQPGTSSRLITLSWDEQESKFAGAQLSVLALAPATLTPYPNQVQGRQPKAVTDQYTPDPPLVDDTTVHQVEVDNLNVLAAENALAGVQIERNRIVIDGFTAKPEFIYMTPVVRATQPVTPLVDNLTPIDIATLPNQNIGTGCPAPPPPGVASLCQRIYTVMFDLLADDDLLSILQGARLAAGLDAGTPRRVKVASGFQYPVATPGGVISANPVRPLVPVVLARSFLIDGSQPAQLGAFSSLYATKVAQWAQNNAIAFGGAAQNGAQFVFDITLYAQLSGLNTPVLRLRNLFLKLTDIAPS
jgi:hypothetical protein